MTETIIHPCRAKWEGTMIDRDRFNRQMHYLKERMFGMQKA